KTRASRSSSVSARASKMSARFIRTTRSSRVWGLLVVGDLHAVGHRQRLARQPDALLEVLRLEDLVVEHLHLALDEHAGAGAARALTARERGVEPFGQQQVQQLRLARPVEFV